VASQVNLLHKLHVYILLTVIFAASAAHPEDFHPPAGNRYAQVTAGGTILPGGRLLRPYGTQIETGAGPFGMAVSPRGTVATADLGFERSGITIVDPPGKTPFQPRHIWARTPNSTLPELADPDWKTVSAGIAFDSEKSLWISEGPTGRIRQIDITTGDHKKIVNLNTSGTQNSFVSDLAYSAARRLLFAVDKANARLVILDARGWRIVSTIKTEPGAFAIALSPDGNTAYVTEEAAVCFIDVRDPMKPAVAGRVPAPSPQALLVAGEKLYTSNARHDSITVISVSGQKAIGEIKLSIPSLETYRGIVPAGLAYDPLTKWLLVAESGINALGVIDTATNDVIGHIPVGWMPVRVGTSGDRVYVANARGRGSRPNPRRAVTILGEPPVLHSGSLSTFIMPQRDEILRFSGTLFSYDGFVPWMHDIPKLPSAIQHVVLILKGNQTFDQVLGDIGHDAAAFPGLSRFGMHGRASGGKTQFSVQDTPMTPNQHAVALRWSFSDNFYVDGDTAAESDIWLRNSLPDLKSEIEMRGATFQVFDDAEASDQKRVDRFILEMNERYNKGSEALPALIILRLPNGRPRAPQPENGYPYDASFVVDNDFAMGRAIAWLSRTKWWPTMTVFITEHDTEGSLDHLDSHRTLLLAAGPYIKKNYVSHLNSDVSGLFRIIAELLGTTAQNLSQATAANMRDMFTAEPDLAPFDAVEPDRRVFDPSQLSAR